MGRKQRNDGSLPKDFVAERRVLGSKLLAPEILNGEFPPTEDFLDPSCAAVAKLIHLAEGRGITPDVESVYSLGSERNELDRFGGEAFLKELVESVPHGGQGKHYAGLVRRLATRRRLMVKLRDALNVAADESIEIPDVLDYVDGLSAGIATEQPRRSIERFTARTLTTQYPRLHAPVIGHLLRAMETMNLISVSKIGKSWLLYSLLLSIVTGRPWLGRFPTARGKVLLIDNELHRATLASRLKTVADAMGITEDEYGDGFDIWPLRGRLRSLFEIGPELESVAGVYQLIGIDAKYRMMPADTDENSNSDGTQFYNEVDRLAELTGAAIGLVHHSSKGSQTDKRVPLWNEV